jgi:acyl carrier protein
MSIEKRVTQIMREQAEIANVNLVTNLGRDSILLESGLDSLLFATIVVLLEQEYGVDPFTAADDVVYPRTLGEFVDLYDRALANTAVS